jgi:hypothetical protein
VSWNQSVKVSGATQGDQFFHWISVGTDGTVGATWLDRRKNFKDYQPVYAVSKDGGATFSAAVPLSTALSDPNLNEAGVSYRTQAWLGNSLYSTWVDTSTGIAQIELGGVQF